MPTRRNANVRIMLKEGRAEVVRTNPFTIRLTYETPSYTQPVTLGIDPGRTNIGLCAVSSKGETLFSAECRTRNKEVPKLMKARAAHRHSHRKHGRREKRQRRAKSNSTVLADSWVQRVLPGCKKPIICEGIKNKEARYLNRGRPEGWLTPTADHLLKTHLNLVKLISKFLPVTDVALELNGFAFMRLDDPFVTGNAFQEGPLKGFDGDVKRAVWSLQEGRCLMCGGPIEAYHHVRARHKGGSETVRNCVGLCTACHKKAHTDNAFALELLSMNAGIRKKYGALGVLNQIMPFLAKALDEDYSLHLTSGRETKKMRILFAIPKTHFCDAYAIAVSDMESINVKPPEACYLIRQFRRHDRQACQKEMINRNYLLKGRIVAQNRRKAFEQAKDSLEEFVSKNGHTDELTIKCSPPVMKNMDRPMPGSRVFYNGKSRIFTGCVNHYYTFDDGSKTSGLKRIKKQQNNNGLVFVSNMGS